MPGDNLITDGSKDREYFIQTPQIVMALCRNPYDFTLWSVIKMVSGEYGICKLSTPDLATLAMMSTGKVSDSRAYLLQVGLLEGSCYREPNYPQPVWHLHIPDIWLQNITWRQLYHSLKDRVELKAKLKALFEEADIYRRFVPENFLQLDGLQDVNVKSLHNMKPSQYEEGPPQNERGIPQNERGPSQNETKKNHVEPNITKKNNPAVAAVPAAAAAEKSGVQEKGEEGTSPIQENIPPPQPAPLNGTSHQTGQCEASLWDSPPIPPPAGDPFTDICRMYRQEIGEVSPFIEKEIRIRLATCRPEWFELAIGKAVEAESRRWRYIKSILIAWEKCGGPENDHRPGKNGANNDNPYRKTTIAGLKERAIDNPVKKRFNPKTGETYFFDVRTQQRVDPPSGSG